MGGSVVSSPSFTFLLPWVPVSYEPRMTSGSIPRDDWALGRELLPTDPEDTYVLTPKP